MTWQALGTRFLCRKEAKSARHVVLGECHVAMGLQRDVVEAVNLFFGRKRSKNRAPRRIGGARCRDGAPTRRGCVRELDFCAEKGTKVGATSHWVSAMSSWGSNATWLRQGAWFLREKGTKTGRHVALAGRDVAMGLQRDVVEAVNLVFARKGPKTGRHVALEEGDVALGVQRDVAEAGILFFGRKRSQNV